MRVEEFARSLQDDLFAEMALPLCLADIIADFAVPRYRGETKHQKTEPELLCYDFMSFFSPCFLPLFHLL